MPKCTKNGRPAIKFDMIDLKVYSIIVGIVCLCVGVVLGMFIQGLFCLR